MKNILLITLLVCLVLAQHEPKHHPRNPKAPQEPTMPTPTPYQAFSDAEMSEIKGMLNTPEKPVDPNNFPKVVIDGQEYEVEDDDDDDDDDDERRTYFWVKACLIFGVVSFALITCAHLRKLRMQRMLRRAAAQAPLPQVVTHPQNLQQLMDYHKEQYNRLLLQQQQQIQLQQQQQQLLQQQQRRQQMHPHPQYNQWQAHPQQFVPNVEMYEGGNRIVDVEAEYSTEIPVGRPVSDRAESLRYPRFD